MYNFNIIPFRAIHIISDDNSFSISTFEKLTSINFSRQIYCRNATVYVIIYSKSINGIILISFSHTFYNEYKNEKKKAVITKHFPNM